MIVRSCGHLVATYLNAYRLHSQVKTDFYGRTGEPLNDSPGK